MNRVQITRRVLFLIAGGGIVFMATGVLVGWLCHIPTLTSVSSVYPSMKFNTALAFLFAGLATMLVDSAEKKIFKYLYLALSAAVYIIGLLTLVEWVFRVDLGFDKLFYYDPTAVDELTQFPGRMVGASALSFCILGAAYMGLMSRSDRIRHWAQYGLHLVTVFALVALMGYLFNLTAAYELAHFTSMAIHTAVAFLALSLTLAFYNPEMGVPGLFTGKGMGNQMARKMFPIMALTTFFLGFIRVKLFKYHLVSIEFGIAMATATFLLVTLLLVWIVAKQLNKLEADKKETDLANYKLSIDIAAEQKARKEIDDANKRNLLFVQQAPSPIAMFDTNMHYLAASEQWVKDYRLEGKEIIGRSHYEVFPEIGDDWKAIHQRCLQGAIDKCEEFYFVRADGAGQWIAWDVRPWYNAENKIGGLLMYTADISHHKKNEALLKEAGETLADAQQIAHIGSWEWQLNTNQLIWSDEQYRIFGFDPGSCVPTIELTNSMVHPEDREKMVLAGIIQAGAKSYNSEFRIIRSDKSVREIEAHGRIFRTPEGRPFRIVGTCADITERKKLERELKKSEREFRSAFEDSAIGMALTNGLGKWIKVNREFCNITGYTEEELMSMSFAEITHPDDLGKDMAYVKQLLAGDIDKYQLEKRYFCKNGSIAWVDLTVSMVFDEARKPLYTVAQMKDITLRKKLERDLRLSEKEFRSSFENSATGMSLAGLDGRWLKVNKELCRITGYTEEEMLNMRFQDITYEETVAADMESMQLMASKQINYYQAEKRYIHKNGHLVWVYLTTSMVYDENNQPLYAVSQMTDISERKKMEADLRKVNSELNSIFRTDIHASIISADVNGVITHFSKGAETLLGYKAEEVVGKYTPALFHDPELIAARGRELSAQFNREITGVEVFMVNVRERDYESREWVHIRKNGTRFPVQLVISAIKDDVGNIKGFLGIGTDITERKEAEEARKNYAVLESRNKEMEEFAYIASHDLQEPLRTVSSFVELLNMDFGDQLPEDAKEYLKFIAGSTKRMSELIKGLLDFSRIGKQKSFEPVDCNEIMREALDDLGTSIKESNAKITVDRLPLILAFRTEMKQLFQNLLSNAIKFRKKDVAPVIHVAVSSLPGYWQFEVSDNGVGIEQRHFHKIFLLFQRLHNRGAYTGTGIGLSYCKKIVELHQGKIWVESVPGEGSRFFFTISKQVL